MSTDNRGSDSFPDDRRYVLRLVVVKVEDVLVNSFSQSFVEWIDWDVGTDLNPDVLFPKWSDQLEVPREELRDQLQEFATSDPLKLNEPLVNFLDEVTNHTPVRAALLSSGPSEWVGALEQTFNLDDVTDLIYCYDNYRHGTRRTLLQFLMNRFIAGKGRTLFVGDSLADQKLADREDTRFCSLAQAPEGSETSQFWGWTMEELRDYVQKIKAED